MALEVTNIQNIITNRLGDSVSDFRMEHDILTFHANSNIIKELIRFLKEDNTLRFNFLTDLCGIHYPDNDTSAQFSVTYLLHNWIDNVRLRVKTFLSADCVEIDTVTDVFASANWMERETYDFYGIVFNGHPNLKRILNDENMVSFPMRKQFPLEDSGRSDKDDRFFGRTPDNYDPNISK